MKLILFGLIGALAAQCLFYYPNLPAIVATHFDDFGRPNSLMPKDLFMIFELALLCLILSETFLIPFVIERLPTRMINIPNRTYWLADENRSAMFASIRSRFEILGVLLVAFFIVVNQIVFRSNVSRVPLPVWQFAGAFIIFIGAVIAWLIGFVRKFRIPANKSNETS